MPAYVLTKPLAVHHDHRLKAVGLALDCVAVERVHLIVDRSVIWFHSLYVLGVSGLQCIEVGSQWHLGVDVRVIGQWNQFDAIAVGFMSV